MILRAVKGLERLAIDYVTLLITSNMLQTYIYYFTDLIFCVFDSFTMSQNCFKLYAIIL